MQLTKAEEQIMQILWELEEATVHDIRENFKGTQPARTTIATILGILENKSFVSHRVDGRSNIYKALVSKEDYSKKQLFGFLKNYFNSSFSSLASFFAKESNLSIEEFDAILEESKKEINSAQKANDD